MDISVITPIYKGNKYIPGIMSMIQKNACNASNLDIELVLVNDSPDIALEVDDSMANSFVLTIVNNEHNLGIHGARVQGIRTAHGKYIILLDQDDELVDNAILKQYSALDGRNAVISNGYAEDVVGNRKLLFKNKKKMRHVNELNYFFYFGNVIASPGLVLIKKDCIPREWMENIMQINGADDWLLWVYTIAKETTFSINPKTLYIFTILSNRKIFLTFYLQVHIRNGFLLF